MDEILIIANGMFTKHMQQLETVLKRLEDKSFCANRLKCYLHEESSNTKATGSPTKVNNPSQRKRKQSSAYQPRRIGVN
jgi:hypothetical protein